MDTKVCDLQRKEIVNIKDGTKLGFVDDVIIDTEQARVRELVVYGRLRLFGLLGRQPDVTIPWERIDVIGEDTILVTVEEAVRETSSRRAKWSDLWS